MRGNYYIIKGPIMAIILGLVLTQLQFIGTKIEAKYQSVGQRKDESDRNYYQNKDNNYFNSNNRNTRKNYPNSGMVPSNFVEQPYDNSAEIATEGNEEHKCNIIIPIETLDKYPHARRKPGNNDQGLVRIETCCKGYEAIRSRGRTLCLPVCENCQNGRCIAPDQCECYDEYVANDNGDCVFTCPIGCLNGQCYLDGSCQCEPGYKLDQTRKFCRPICSKGCGTNILHNCTEPEVCGCVKGYVLGDRECEPVCQHDCGIGGVCKEPNYCDCKPGFTYKGQSREFCHATCYQKCDNGICFSPNRCICNPGFTYHERSTTCVAK